ncbi:MAG: XisH family protein [Spirulinaceae cyanobacterium]
MPAKDIYHSTVRFALIKDGWTILAEDYPLVYGEDRLYVDLAAEKVIAATRQERKILVEIKSFIGRSFVKDLEQAVGQYVIYRDILEAGNENFELYLAIAQGVYTSKFQRKLAQLIIQRNNVNLMVFDSEAEAIAQWIN